MQRLYTLLTQSHKQTDENQQSCETPCWRVIKTKTPPQSRAAAAAASLILSCRLSSSPEPLSPASYCTAPTPHTHTHRYDAAVCEAENRSVCSRCVFSLPNLHTCDNIPHMKLSLLTRRVCDVFRSVGAACVRSRGRSLLL